MRRWVQAQCHSLTDLDTPEVNPLLQQAAAALRQRPVLFRYCAEEVATARHNAVFQNFVTALTQGGPNGMPRPIEMHAHDPRSVPRSSPATLLTYRSMFKGSRT